ncbi:hypothetical protein BGW36DRAFT_371272 [Talaromyces proteolyticus]|uniref:Uncharacterized protein n=1 Tax=Talaromyces proteolyticus TaxID=1131652 RepID=A0AAD4Q3D6_9EURO|nr:uncharacterized protein BGW36DRAFT_371272 [Talaromyces proteolyticus]KAH8701663.1 hypothetical protein BGW36DRAFT_371272 [Talaromyces proteolyticus]
MGRQSVRSPFLITARSSSIMAETTYKQKPSPTLSSQEFPLSDRSRKAHRILGDYNSSPQLPKREENINNTLDSRGFDRYSHAAAAREPNPTPSHHELRVRASSPLLGRNYHSSQRSTVSSHHSPELPQVRKSGSWSDLRPSPHTDSYSFDTQSQRSLAFGVVEDMRGILFANKGPIPKDVTPTKPESAKDKKKKMRPSRIDLSLLFPKPKPASAPLLSPQRYTNSPSPVHSEFSATKRTSSTKLTKPRSRSNSRKEVQKDVIPEEPLPIPSRPRKTQVLDWFDIPVEKSIRVGGVNIEDDTEVDDEDFSPSMVSDPPPQIHLPKQHKEANLALPTSAKAASRRSSLTSRASRRTSYTIDSHLSPQPTTPFSERLSTSLQAWQSEGDLRLRNPKPALSKKSSHSTLMISDLTKTSVLSLSSSEDEDDGEDRREEDENYGELLVKRATPQRAFRESVSTFEDFEPEICTAEAVVATRGHALTQLNRAHSKMSTSSSDSHRTARRQSHGHQSYSSNPRSSVTAKRQDSRASRRVSLIEEREELTDTHNGNSQLRPVPAYSNMHSAKRRSRIIAVTRQEESILEAMRLRNGRFTPSMYGEISTTPNPDSESESTTSRSMPPAPRIQEPAHTPDYGTSFLRLSTVMSPSQGTALSMAGEGATSKDKEAFMSLSSASDNEQKTETNSTASPRLSLAYSETHSSSSTTGYTSPMTPTLPIHRFSPRAPPPSHAPPPIPPEAAKRHSRRRTDSSEAIRLDDEVANDKEPEVEYPLWAIKWARDSVDLAVVT